MNTIQKPSLFTARILLLGVSLWFGDTTMLASQSWAQSCGGTEYAQRNLPTGAPICHYHSGISIASCGGGLTTGQTCSTVGETRLARQKKEEIEETTSIFKLCPYGVEGAPPQYTYDDHIKAYCPKGEEVHQCWLHKFKQTTKDYEVCDASGLFLQDCSGSLQSRFVCTDGRDTGWLYNGSFHSAPGNGLYQKGWVPSSRTITKEEISKTLGHDFAGACRAAPPPVTGVEPCPDGMAPIPASDANACDGMGGYWTASDAGYALPLPAACSRKQAQCCKSKDEPTPSPSPSVSKLPREPGLTTLDDYVPNEQGGAGVMQWGGE